MRGKKRRITTNTVNERDGLPPGRSLVFLAAVFFFFSQSKLREIWAGSMDCEPAGVLATIRKPYSYEFRGFTYNQRLTLREVSQRSGGIPEDLQSRFAVQKRRVYTITIKTARPKTLAWNKGKGGNASSRSLFV